MGNRGMASQTTVTVTQRQVQRAEGDGEWSTGICDCCIDPAVFFYSCCCPWAANASARTEYDGSNWCFNCIFVSPCLVRSIVREGAFNIGGSCVGDICYSMCCLPCSISQMLREVRVRNTLAETQAFSG